METLTANPAFRSYALCSALLGLKMLLSAVYTGSRRQKHHGYVNAEDARVFGGPGDGAAVEEAPAVAHALRIQRNDLEAIPIFFAVGLVYVLTGASPFGAFFSAVIASKRRTRFFAPSVATRRPNRTASSSRPAARPSASPFSTQARISSGAG